MYAKKPLKLEEQNPPFKAKSAESVTHLLQQKMATNHHNENTVAEISMKEFLDFLKISYQVNESIEKPSSELRPGDEKTSVDWKKLTAYELISRLKEKEIIYNKQKGKMVAEKTNVKPQVNFSEETEKATTKIDPENVETRQSTNEASQYEEIEKNTEESATTTSGLENQSAIDRQLSATFLGRKVALEKEKKNVSCRRKSCNSRSEGSGESEKSSAFENAGDGTPTTALKKKLNEVLQEGILDSILPYILPKQQQTSQENAQPSVKKVLNSTNDSKKAGMGNGEKFSPYLTKDKSDLKKIKNQNDVENDKKDREVIIHVCDEIKNLKRDFKCSQKLLVSQMNYFAEVTNGQKLEDMDISVHCDITIFDWLMRWVQKDGHGQKNLPVLDSSIVIPVLMSSAFLQMDSLQEYCLQYCQNHINDIIRDSPNLGCINDNVLTSLANIFSNAEIERIVDKKDKIQSKLFCKLILALCEPEPQPRRGHYSSVATMYRCSKCRKLILKNMSGSISCCPSNMTMDQNGVPRSVHSYDATWNFTEYVKELKNELKTWRRVYWRLWSDCHLLFCNVCEEYFPVHQMSWCLYHLEPVQYFHFESQKTLSHPMGRYSCCGERAYRFEVIKKVSGCQYRDHALNNSKTANEAEILRIWNLFKDVINCEPPPITSNVKFIKSGFNDGGRSLYKEGFWWDGLKLIPSKQPPGLLSKIWDTVTRKEDRLGANSSESKMQRSPVSKSLNNTLSNLHDMSSFSDSSDESCSSSNAGNSEESYHSMSKQASKIKAAGSSTQHVASARLSIIRKEKQKRKKKKKIFGMKNDENRFWLARLSTRSNQDNQRDFEERALKQIELMLAKKLCGESFRATGNRNSHQNLPAGGIYVKLEQEWRESHCFSHGCPGSSIKARGSASYVNVNSNNFMMQKRSKSRGYR